ncbi:MAG TPA: hypothetical protein VN040_11730 [Pseudosphingobacterium sp.]|nr:hypothetical protein [Pseudosphingobacterium sp.]
MLEIITLLGFIVSLLLAVIAYFLKQFHKNVLQMEQDLRELKISIHWIKAKVNGHYEMLRYRIEQLEKNKL